MELFGNNKIAVVEIVLLSLLLISRVSAQCSVCGEGRAVTAPDEIFIFPGQPDVQCGLLQTAGESGFIPLDECVGLPPLLSICQCRVM